MSSEEATIAGRNSPSTQPDTESDKRVDTVGSMSTAEENAPSELPLDIVFELLKNRRRRRVLRYLEEEADTADLGTLAEALAAEENDKSIGALSSSERKRVYICLYQCHLPKLDDAGVIEFDSDRGTICKSDATSELIAYLDRLRVSTDEADTGTDETVWPARYFGFTFAGGGMYVLQSVFFPSALLSLLLVASLIGGVLVISSLHLAGL